MPAVDQRTLLLAGIALVAGAVLARRSRPGTSGPRPSCDGVGPTEGVVAGIHYYETINGGANATDLLPMVISFHGMSDSASGAPSLKAVPGKYRVIRPDGPLGSGDRRKWFATSATGPDAPLEDSMSEQLPVIAAFVEGIARCRPTVGRPIVVGHSQGGHVAYLLASKRPGLIHSAIATNGYLPPAMRSPAMASTVGIHATGDPYWDKTSGFWADVTSGLTRKTLPGGHSMTSDMVYERNRALAEMIERLG